jgi:acetyl-CoA decarbonylase/synthase complex subunit delta
MPMKKVPQKFNASITEVTIGTGDKALKLAGECTFPLYSFDAPEEWKSKINPPRVGVEVLDDGTDADVVERAKKACTYKGAEFVSLVLAKADPNGANASSDVCCALAKKVSDAVSLPLVIQGCKNVEKDAELFNKIAEALQGKNVLLLSAKEENHKTVAAAGVLAYGQKIGAESAVDLNLAKQLNVLISQVGVKNDSMVMNVGEAAVGYGFEYVVTTMDRVRGAALTQNDTTLQIPIFTPVSTETCGVKESACELEDAPTPEWGPAKDRSVAMEVSTAAACIAAGSNAVILRSPEAVEAVSKFIHNIV